MQYRLFFSLIAAAVSGLACSVGEPADDLERALLDTQPLAALDEYHPINFENKIIEENAWMQENEQLIESLDSLNRSSYTMIASLYWGAREDREQHKTVYICSLIPKECGDLKNAFERRDLVTKGVEGNRQWASEFPDNPKLKITCRAEIGSYNFEQHGFPISSCLNRSRKGSNGQVRQYGTIRFSVPNEFALPVTLYPGIEAAESDLLYQDFAEDRARLVESKLADLPTSAGKKKVDVTLYGRTIASLSQDDATGPEAVLVMAVDGYEVILPTEAYLERLDNENKADTALAESDEALLFRVDMNTNPPHEYIP